MKDEYIEPEILNKKKKEKIEEEFFQNINDLEKLDQKFNKLKKEAR